MGFVCKLGLHSWDGKRCSKCGIIKDSNDSKETKTEKYPIYSDKHIAAKEIMEVEKDFTQSVKISIHGSQTLTSFNTIIYLRIKEILDRVIDKDFDNPDLFYARASLHYLALQGKDGMEDRDKCLSLCPEHLDANMHKKHFNIWNNIFEINGWDETQKEIPDLMKYNVENGLVAQVVRNNLRIAIAIVLPLSKVNLTGCNKMRWELKWVKTPHGKIAAHYLFFDSGKFAEFFIPSIQEHTPEQRMNHSYWLLRRLALETYCFIVISDGNKVVRNEKYIFPSNLILTLKSMGKDILQGDTVSSISAYQMATQWYMNNSDINDLKY